MTGAEPPWSIHKLNNRQLLVKEAGYSSEISGLAPIQLAEFLVASKSAKVSRISIPASNVKQIGFALLAKAAVATSSRAILSKPDDRLSGFSNVSSEAVALGDPPSNAEIYFYVHADAAYSNLAAILDYDDAAGELLGIPLCCRRWYAAEWEMARSSGGDLFAVMLRAASKDGKTDVAIECDASSMYRGGGLCWHFPCSPTCPATIETVSARRSLIEKSDPSLLVELDRATRSIFTLMPDGTYVDGECALEGAVVVAIKRGQR